jgi:hypothetical protein
MWKPVYASLAEMRDWLRVRNIEDTDDDALLTLKLSASSRAVDGTCHRQFGKVDTAVVRSYDLGWSRSRQAYMASIDDLMDLTGLTVGVEGVALSADQYKLRPRNALADGMPYTWILVTGGWSGCGPVELEMSALWGWNQPWPDSAKEATLLQASRLNIRRDSPYGIAGGVDGSSELRLLERLDPDVAPLMSGLVRVGWVAK